MRLVNIFIVICVSSFLVACSSSQDSRIVMDNDVMNTESQSDVSSVEKTNPSSENLCDVVKINDEEFKQLVFDYTTNSEWVFNKQLPCIVDFYADWCRPCKMVAPIMDELSIKYNGKVNFYKVNIDDDKILAQVFGIQNIPSLLFCPIKGEPQICKGAYNKDEYVNFIEEILLK